jgi:hypothetical protein
MKYTDSYGNTCTRHVEWPDAIAQFFAPSNVIDISFDREKWLTKNAYFYLSTTIIGINVTEAYHLANYHGAINYSGGGTGEKKFSIQYFACILSNQLIKNAERWGSVDKDFFQRSWGWDKHLQSSRRYSCTVTGSRMWSLEVLN